jgi:hypothetical protein
MMDFSTRMLENPTPAQWGTDQASLCELRPGKRTQMNTDQSKRFLPLMSTNTHNLKIKSAMLIAR